MPTELAAAVCDGVVHVLLHHLLVVLVHHAVPAEAPRQDGAHLLLAAAHRALRHHRVHTLVVQVPQELYGEASQPRPLDGSRACFGSESIVTVSRYLKIHSFMQNRCSTTKHSRHDQISWCRLIVSMQIAHVYFWWPKSRSRRSRRGRSELEIVDTEDKVEIVDTADTVEATDMLSSSARGNTLAAGFRLFLLRWDGFFFSGAPFAAACSWGFSAEFAGFAFVLPVGFTAGFAAGFPVGFGAGFLGGLEEGWRAAPSAGVPEGAGTPSFPFAFPRCLRRWLPLAGAAVVAGFASEDGCGVGAGIRFPSFGTNSFAVFFSLVSTFWVVFGVEEAAVDCFLPPAFVSFFGPFAALGVKSLKDFTLDREELTEDLSTHKPAPTIPLASFFPSFPESIESINE